LEKVLGHFLYPNYDEISIHENKKYLSYWLKANDIPHPKTWVFYRKDEALNYAKTCIMPVVGKMNIGASGKGVNVFRKRHELAEYIKRAFSGGLRQAWGPNLKMGMFYDRFMRIIHNPGRILKRVKAYQKNYSATQKNFVILQEWVEHKYEWRVVKIGNSYFGHQKVKQGDKASGTKGIDYILPPEKLLFLVKETCQRFGFNTMAVDLFEDGKDGYLVNEMQCIFGHVQEFICSKDGKPGRFILKENQWKFEEGLFNHNLSYDLRMKDVLSLLSEKHMS
jgi:glutathione synthase/RimK-type ligase-like ATP-grasp enzyme